MSKSKIGVLLVLTIVAVLAIAGCGGEQNEIEIPAQQPEEAVSAEVESIDEIPSPGPILIVRPNPTTGTFGWGVKEEGEAERAATFGDSKTVHEDLTGFGHFFSEAKISSGTETFKKLSIKVKDDNDAVHTIVIEIDFDPSDPDQVTWTVDGATAGYCSGGGCADLPKECEGEILSADASGDSYLGEASEVSKLGKNAGASQ